jgi:MoaA/NifB/PqqE/SkfB family radical SAM enzyme
LVKYIPTLKEAKFYGGEPFLIPIYYKIWEKVRELNPKLEMFVITNGTHWNAKIEKLVNELNFDMAISIDAFEKEKVERIRKNVVYEKLMDNIKRFSEILTRKGKYLSLSFTVQKDNWEQFPLIIDLCNEVNAFIYVSYLERPVRFALADLPQDELRKIREYMDKYTFPKGNQREQHNDKCFEDFKHYLDAYVEHADVKKYADYGFNRDMLISAEAEQKEEFKEAIPVPFSVLGAWIEGQYSANKTFSEKLPKEIMFRQLNTLLSTFSEEDRDQLHAIIMQGAFEPFLNSVKTEAQEQLKQSGYDTLEKYRRLMTEVV